MKTKVLQPKMLPIDLLEENPRNPNILSEDLYERLKRAISRFGFVQPILVAKGKNGKYIVVDGNHRLKVARELGIKEIPAVITNDDVRAQSISMNKLRGTLDGNIVAELLAELQKDGWELPDLTLTGFSEDEILAMLSPPEPTVNLGKLQEPLEEAETKEFVLELKFTNEDDYKFVKKVLRKFGKGKGYTEGLLNICRMVVS